VRYHTAILLTRFGEFEVANQMLTEFAAEASDTPQVLEAFGAGRAADAERERAEFTRLDQLVRAMRNGLPAVGGIPSAGPGRR
jgi:hypothetical protein